MDPSTIDTASQSTPGIPAQTEHDQTFILQKIQPALLGLMDGSVSTLAPIFATAGLTGKPMDAFFVGLAASVGAGISMGLAEALSDDGVVYPPMVLKVTATICCPPLFTAVI